MAKGDEIRTRNKADYNQARGETLYGQSKAGLDAQGSMFGSQLNNAVASDEALRNNAVAGYDSFAKTGGLSPTDIAAIRSRSISPIRAAYSNAERNVSRGMNSGVSGSMNPALGGLLQARMAREQGQGAADATTNAEAGIASLVSQNKLAGLGGMANLYGTTPGASALWSGNVLKNTGQQLDLNQMENNRMQGILNSWNDLTKAPGTGERYVGSATNLIDAGSKIFRPSK